MKAPTDARVQRRNRLRAIIAIARTHGPARCAGFEDENWSVKHACPDGRHPDRFALVTLFGDGDSWEGAWITTHATKELAGEQADVERTAELVDLDTGARFHPHFHVTWLRQWGNELPRTG